MALRDQGRLTEAIESYRQSIQLAPDLALAVELKRVEHLHRRLSVGDFWPMVTSILCLVAGGYGLWRWGGLGAPEIAVSRFAVVCAPVSGRLRRPRL